MSLEKDTPACRIKGHTIGGWDGEQYWCVECTAKAEDAFPLPPPKRILKGTWVPETLYKVMLAAVKLAESCHLHAGNNGPEGFAVGSVSAFEAYETAKESK